MDSDNSGSMQSSSGGDEEYDSRVESISSFLNQTTNNNNHNPLSHHHVGGPMPPPPPPQNHHSAVFEPLSSFFDPLSTPSSSSRSAPPLSNPNSLLNLDMVWSKNLRSEPNCTDLGGFMSVSTLNQPQNRPTIPSVQIPQPGTSNPLSVTGSTEHVITVNQNQTSSNNNVVGRNPKKRSRASRRAPTTVLTTDTANFRAMVQEFTGIPAPPFTSSPFPRSRFDLYGTSSPTLRSATAAAHLDPAPPTHPSYLLRPFAQKIQPPTSSFLASSSSSSMVDAIVSATTTPYTNINTSTTAVSNSSTSINYQQLPQNLLNISMQNPILNFQPLLPPPKYPLQNLPGLGSAAAGKPSQQLQQQVSLENIPSGDSHLKMSNLLEDFGLSHGLQSMVPQQGSTGDLNESGGDHQQQGLFMSINGNYGSSQTVASNGKLVNFSAASSSDFLGDKVQENAVKTRGEGMMESWICSSD